MVKVRRDDLAQIREAVQFIADIETCPELLIQSKVVPKTNIKTGLVFGSQVIPRSVTTLSSAWRRPRFSYLRTPQR